MATETFSGAKRVIQTVTANIQTKPGMLARIIVVAGTGQVDAYDHGSLDTNPVFSKTVTAVGDIYELGVPLQFGLRVKMSAAGTLCVVYS